MNKTIRISNWKDVHVGDMLFVKGRSEGYRVTLVQPIGVDNPFGYGTACVRKDRFVYAERTIEEPEWPQPSDHELHVYLGADGKRYIYNLCAERYSVPWSVEHSTEVLTQRQMAIVFPKALPLTELKLVQEEDES